MSALPSTTDIHRRFGYVSFVPLPDSCTAAQDLEGPATIAKLVNIALLNSEAVEEPIPAGAAEVALAATARVHSESWLATFSYAHPRRWPLRRDYLRTPELSGAAPIVGAPGAGVLLTPGPVLLQVGTAFVVPTDGQ
jgi:hypothetical protein